MNGDRPEITIEVCPENKTFAEADTIVKKYAKPIEIDAQVAELKNGWAEAIPQIGGILKYNLNFPHRKY